MAAGWVNKKDKQKKLFSRSWIKFYRKCLKINVLDHHAEHVGGLQRQPGHLVAAVNGHFDSSQTDPIGVKFFDRNV